MYNESTPPGLIGESAARIAQMRHPRRVSVLFALLALAGCARARDDRPLQARPLPTPAGPGSGEPNLAVGPDGQVLLSWVEGAGEQGHELRFATRPRGGGWSESRGIAQGRDWFVNWADFPSLAALPDGALFAHWLEKSGPGTYAYDVRVSVSGDGGKKWSTPVVPHTDRSQAEHGFVSMSPSTPTAMGLVWIDGRKASEMSLMHGTVGADGRAGAETVLDDRVCDCCQTAMVHAEGATVVVYRDRSASEVRDIAVVRFAGGRWSEPRRVANDGWEMNGCPVNGPALAAAGARVAVAWFTAADEVPRVKVAFSEDSAASFAPPIVVDDGRPLGRVGVVFLGDGRALVSWLEQAERGAELRVRRVTADGLRDKPLTVADSSGARSSGFPRMVESDGEVILAWRDAAEPPRIRTAVVALAP
jgi:hypothetical protein